MRKLLPIILLLFIGITACGGRVPSDVKTANLTKKFFHKYGKKYQETPFFKNPVKAVEIKKTQELQKNLATSFVLVNLAAGQELPIILTMIRKFPLGWRITSWEQIQN